MGIISASDLININNISAEQGDRGPRGITGPKGRPAIYGAQGVPGLPGPSGNSKIDIVLQGETTPYITTYSSRYKSIANIIFPGTTEWGRDLLRFKVACSFDKNSNYPTRTVLSASITLTDVTDPSNHISLLSSNLYVEELLTLQQSGEQIFYIIQNGSPIGSLDNEYVTLKNLPANEAILRVSVSMESVTSGGVPVSSGLNIYAIEIY